jgi:hypothetical protein
MGSFCKNFGNFETCRLHILILGFWALKFIFFSIPLWPLFYLELIWQMENPKIPFLEWCVDMQISDQMSMRKLMFGESIQKCKLYQNDPKNAPRIYESWKNSFEKHFLPFDEWYKPELVNKLPRSKLTITPFISMYHFHTEAHQILLSVPPDELNDYLNLHLSWSSSLIRSQ